VPFVTKAQITLIPDQNFENHLVYWGYDTDGVINGQILTADALNVTELDFVNKAPFVGINKLDGLNDFTNLEILKVAFGNIPNGVKSANFSNLTKLKKVYFDNYSLTHFDVTPLTSLEELKLGNFTSADNPVSKIRQLNLSNSKKVTYLHVRELYDLEYINLRNNLASSVSVIIELGTSNAICIEVDDHIAATNGLSPYNTWSITSNGVTNYPNYYYSDKCALSVEKFVNDNFKIYPNPATDYVSIEQKETNGVTLQSVQILDSSGKWIKSVKDNFSQIDVSTFSKGMYLFVIQTDKGNKTEKILIK